MLVVDGSPRHCQIIRQVLDGDGRIEVVGTAHTIDEARALAMRLRPDVATYEPEGQDAAALGEWMLSSPFPVVVVTNGGPGHENRVALAMAAGASFALAKPRDRVEMERQARKLRELVVQAAARGVPRRARRNSLAPQPLTRAPRPVQARDTPRIVCIGSSTGGPSALMSLVESLPADPPAIVIAQHMQEGYTAALARRMGQRGNLVCEEARPGAAVVPGRIWVAPGTHHVKLARAPDGFRLLLDRGPEVNGHRPSVDVLFQSAAKVAGANAVGVLLTGMGRDGAKGLLEMRRAGARTLAQDEGSCVVYGMPKAAMELRAAEEQGTPAKLAVRLHELAWEGVAVPT